MSKDQKTAVLTPYFRVSFPSVFKPRRNDLSGRDEYSVVALFPKDADLATLKSAAEAAMIKKWGENKAKWPKGLRSPFRDQGERAKTGENGNEIMPDGYTKGAIMMNLKSTNKPTILAANKDEITDETDFYPGCWARAYINAYAYDNKGNRGVAFGLQHIQKVKDGDPFGNRVRAEDAFAPVESENGPADSAADLFS